MGSRSGDEKLMNVLETRYASAEMREIWSPIEKIRAERRLWLLVMKAQSDSALRIPSDAIKDYEKVLDEVDLNRINVREREIRHDVKARIEEFNGLAGHEYVHIGMTSRDLTENIEAWQVLSALRLVLDRAIGVLTRMSKRAQEFRELPITARTHNVPAQVTTLGKRFATIAEELLIAVERLEFLISRYPCRGIRGPVGTGADIRDLMGESYTQLDQKLLSTFGFSRILDSTSQVSHRSLDFEVVSTLLQLAAAPSNLALMIRNMAGHHLITEGFGKNQVGSSAMPHKVNPRSSERINSLIKVLAGYLSMVVGITGEQWNEGDVSDSALRRVALADSFYALDGIFLTTMTILDELEVSEKDIEKELKENLPNLITTKLLSESILQGKSREVAYSALKEISVKLQKGGATNYEGEFLKLVAEDSRLTASQVKIREWLSNPLSLTGLAKDQVNRVAERIQALIKSHPDAARYEPEKIL